MLNIFLLLKFIRWTCKEVGLLLVPQSSALTPIFILEVGNGNVGSCTTLHNSSSDKDEKQEDGGTKETQDGNIKESQN